MRHLTACSMTLVMLLACLAPIGAQVHKDSELGFQVRYPRSWKKIPIATSETWIVAKYLSKRDLWGKKGGGVHTPIMKVILFPHQRKKGVDVSKSGKNSYTLKVKNPYKDFNAYLKGNAQGGYYPVKEVESKINKIPTTCMEILYEKLTTPRRAYAWIYHGKDADWVVYFEALDDYWSTLSPEFKRSLKSFKFIKRSGSLVRGGTTGTEIPVSTKDLSPEAKAKRRKQRFDVELHRAKARMDKGWRIQKSKNFVALTHVNKKYTSRVLKQAEAVRKWLDKKFAWVGEGRPGRVMIRICADVDEEMAYRDTSNDAWGGTGIEVTTHKYLSEGKQGYESQWVNTRVASIWFRDKNEKLGWGMPSWLTRGLGQYLGTAYVKSGRLVFKPDTWEATRLRELVRKKQIVEPEKLVTSTWSEFMRTSGASYQAGAFIRFLMNGPKSVTKGVLRSYFTAVLNVIEEEARKDKNASKSKKKETEEEQEKRFQALRQKEKKRIQSVFDHSFGSWPVGKWKKFSRSYMSWVAK